MEQGCGSVTPSNQYDLERLAQKLIEIEGFETLGDQANRQKAIVEAVSYALSAGLQAGFRALLPGTLRPPHMGDAIAYILLPIKLPPDTDFDAPGLKTYRGHEYQEISYFLPKGPDYKGYDRKEKLERVAQFVKQMERS